MRAWLWSHVDAFAGTLARLARAPVATLLNVGVLGIALALPAGFYVVLANVQGYASAFAADPRLSVFMKVGTPSKETREIETRLQQHSDVRTVRYIPRDEALKQLSERTGLADVAESLPENPLPDAFVVEPRDVTPPALERLRDELRGWPGVAQVELDALWARRLEAGLRLARLAVLLLAALFAFALVAVTFNTIRLQILTRREEIEVAKLIGATDPFIRRPLLYFGSLQGLAGGLAAWVIVAVSLYLLNDGLASVSQLYGTRIELQPLGIQDGLSLLLFAAALGWLGAWLSVNQHLARLDLR
jgi:cell division transport system permease protein